MKNLLPVLLLLITTICNAGDWNYTGSATEFIPTSSQLGEGWSRSLIRTVNKENELKGLFQSTAPIELGPTTSYEMFRRDNKIRELSELEFYFEDEALGRQTYQLVIFLFPDTQELLHYWKKTHPEYSEVPVFTTVTQGTHACIFRLQNIYVRVSSKSLAAECERIAGLVFTSIQKQERESNQSR
jgi:hypothetical protein